MANARDRLMGEYINYGGAAYRRSEVYQDVRKVTGDKWAADLFAFGPNARVIPEEDRPYFLAVRAMVEGEESDGR